ncbi:MAG TPA: 2-dehydro-3-deoxy-phosphogluconate aldolase [Rhizobiaceae bacterium]|nr:2-dehydro-3-deoxy-phosphogluconate aldolase [Rhizobiaceae bacterium]
MRKQKHEALEPVLTGQPVIPVIVVERARDAVPLARALAAGGLPAVEITLRTPDALDAIRLIEDEVKEAIVGAGTVLNARQYDKAVAAGAKFIVSPGTTQELLDAAADSDVPMLPGAATPSEVMAMLEEGYRYLKFFPAEQSGGVAYLKSISSPLPQARFCPTGGITLKNARDYLSLPNVVCIGGSWVAPKDRIEAGDWAAITALARETLALRE